jgi:hypothetical protein
VLIQRPDEIARDRHPLVHLAQRMPSFVQVRSPVSDEDRLYPSAFVLNDTGGYFFRVLSGRPEGEGSTARARPAERAARAVREHLAPERARSRIPPPVAIMRGSFPERARACAWAAPPVPRRDLFARAIRSLHAACRRQRRLRGGAVRALPR